MNKNKKITIYSVLLMLILIVAIGITYAYFTAQITGQESSTTISTDSGTLSIVYANGSGVISASNISPDSTPFATKTFTVTGTNTTTKYMPYTINLIIDTNTFSANAISYTFDGVNTDNNGGIASAVSNTGITGTTTVVLGSGFFANGTSKVHTYTLKMYYLETNTDQSADMNKTFSGHITITSSKALIGPPANAPKLADNMIPVYYDNANDVWVKADVNNANATYKWHDYDAQMWANAVTVTSTTRSTYTSAAVGTQIPMSDILGMWVWIPRYEYMTTNLGTNYAGGTQALPGGISIKFISGTSTTNDTNYLIHPAFRNGTVYKYSADYDLGGWDKELTGFWMGKFETGYATNNTTNAAISSNILVKPDVYSMRYQKVSNEYTTVANIQSDHGIGSTVETHMSKNDEWGAVAYLSQSAYGKYGNSDYTGANKEIYVNNALYSTGGYFYTTGRSNGVYGGGTGSGSTQYGTYEYNNCPASGYTHTACMETVRNTNNTKGTGASTTGNIYGVYDMSGGAYEYVMANVSGTIGSSGVSSMSVQKYWNKYTSTTLASACNGSQCYGQAITETGTGSNNGNYQWYNDYRSFVTSSNPWAIRGLGAGNASNTSTGVFLFSYDNGGANPVYGVRASISLK